MLHLWDPQPGGIGSVIIELVTALHLAFISNRVLIFYGQKHARLNLAAGPECEGETWYLRFVYEFLAHIRYYVNNVIAQSLTLLLLIIQGLATFTHFRIARYKMLGLLCTAKTL